MPGGLFALSDPAVIAAGHDGHTYFILLGVKATLQMAKAGCWIEVSMALSACEQARGLVLGTMLKAGRQHRPCSSGSGLPAAVLHEEFLWPLCVVPVRVCCTFAAGFVAGQQKNECCLHCLLTSPDVGAWRLLQPSCHPNAAVCVCSRCPLLCALTLWTCTFRDL